MMTERFMRFSLAISEISRHLHKLTSEELAKHGLKGPHAIYLTTLYMNSDGLTVPQLCQLCGKDKSDASRMISILEEKKFVEKQGGGKSTYGGVVKLTSEGKHAAEQICKKASRAVEIAGKDLSDEERPIFYASLDSITANLRKLSHAGIPE